MCKALRGFSFFFCSNALIALARSLCKCLLAQLITASGAALRGFSRRPCGEVGRAVSFDIADRLPVVVRFPAGPQVSLKVGDQPKGRWRRPKKKSSAGLQQACLRFETRFFV